MPHGVLSRSWDDDSTALLQRVRPSGLTLLKVLPRVTDSRQPFFHVLGVPLSSTERLDNVKREKGRHRRIPDQRAVTAPRPIPRVTAQSSANRIQVDVTTSLGEMPLALDEARAIQPAEQMTAPAMAVVVRLRVQPVQRAHSSRERLADPEDEGRSEEHTSE